MIVPVLQYLVVCDLVDFTDSEQVQGYDRACPRVACGQRSCGFRGF